jgi:hypothetical protein
MAGRTDIRNTIEAEKKLFTSPEFSDIQESLARGGKVNAEEIPLGVRENLGLKDGQKIKLSRIGMINFIQDRMKSEESPTGYRNLDVTNLESARNTLVNRFKPNSIAATARDTLLSSMKKAKKKELTADEIAAIDEALGLGAPKPTSPEATGAIIPAQETKRVEKPGSIDWTNIGRTLLNKQLAKGRPILEDVKSIVRGIPGGAMGVAESVMAGAPKEGENPLMQYLKQFERTYGGALSKLAGVPMTRENAALEALNKLYPTGIYPSEKGLKRFAGVGRFKTQYGNMYIDQSGALVKEPTAHAGALRNI